MFIVNPIKVYSNPTCIHEVAMIRLFSKNVECFDKAGFQLTELECEYYMSNNFTLNNNIQNPHSHQQEWFTMEKNDSLFLNHSTILHRCDFTESAKEQLIQFQPQLPKLTYLIQCNKKWGLDFCLDYFDKKVVHEVVHTKTNFFTLEECTVYKENIEKIVLATDWKDAAKRLISKKDEWSSLIGFAQNDWKAKFFGFPKAELTHKALLY